MITYHDTVIETHHGHPVLREVEPIEIAIVPVTGRALHESIILHPRYVPNSVPHRVEKMRVYRRGRTLDVFLDEPVEHDGNEYGVLNFKGVGADTYCEDMVVHPTLWYTERGWVPANRCHVSHDRQWGIMRRTELDAEYASRLLEDLGISQVPHFSANPIPDGIRQMIGQQYQNPPDHSGQLVRPLHTNIRQADHEYHHVVLINNALPELSRYVDLERLASIDAAVFNAQCLLAKQGKILTIDGIIPDNRYLDGRFTDLENYEIVQEQPRHINEQTALRASEFVGRCRYASHKSLSAAAAKEYGRLLKKKTGLRYAGDIHDNEIRRELYVRFDLLFHTYKQQQHEQADVGVHL